MKKVSNHELYTTSIGTSVEACLEKIEINNSGTIVVLKNKMVVGTVTDGDIRKLLINKRSLIAPVQIVMNQDYKWCRNRAGCEKIFEEFPHIKLIPVLTESRNLLEIYLR